MNRFCLQCGHEAKVDDVICTNCGTKLPELENTSTPQQESEPKRTKQKKPLTKMQKTLFIAGAAVVVILIAGYVFATNYFSKESITDRFDEALSSRDADKLASLMVHEDGSSITTEEAEAFIELKKEEDKDYVEEFIRVKQSDNFLGIITRFKVYADDQYAYFEGSAEGMSFKFNEKVVTGEKHKEKVVFGPFVAGIYTVGIDLDNEFGKDSTKVEEFRLAQKDDVEIVAEVSEAMISIDNYDEELMSDVYILINGDKKIPVKDGKSEKFGPLFLNGSTTATIVATYPWGEVKSEAYKLEEENPYLLASMFSDSVIEGIETSLLDFGEQLANAKASKSISVLTNVTDSYKENLKETIDYYIENNYFYTGQLDAVKIDEDSLYLTENRKVYIDAKYQYTEDDLYQIDDSPETSSEDYDVSIGLVYDEKSKSWLVDSMESLWGYVEETKTLNGSKKLYSPDDKVVQSQKDKNTKESLQEFMSTYLYAGVSALNSRDIFYVEEYLVPNSPAVKGTESYYKSVEENEIYEEFLSTEVTDVKDKGNNTYEVTSIDKYIIEIAGEESEESYNTITTVKKVDDEWLVYEIVDTKPIK